MWSISDVERRFQTNIREGLSSKEAARRLKEHGPNELPAGKPDGFFFSFLRQFKSPLIYVLLSAAGIVLWLGNTSDAVIIVAVLLFNALLGAFQEGRTQHTLRALRQFIETRATVLREGKELLVIDREIVPGDIVVLREGDRVPADVRLIETHSLTVDQSSLTGESLPVHKDAAAALRPDTPLADRSAMAFQGTAVTRGDGSGIVTATGGNSEIGKISAALAVIDTETPLARSIRSLSRMIVASVAIVTVVLFTLGIALGHPPAVMFETVVALAVSLIPEGLPLVLTMVLATGAWRLAKRHALVKRLQAVEALGQARVIAVDKTGTLTRNELIVRRIVFGGAEFHVGGVGYEPEGDVRLGDAVIDPANHPELLLAGKIAALTSSAIAVRDEDRKIWRVAGDPTEAALAVCAKKLGFVRADLEREMPRVAEEPFDYETKYHATLHRVSGKDFLSVVGAPEALFRLATACRRDGKTAPFEKSERYEAEQLFHALSRDGFRVVAFGYAEEAHRAEASYFPPRRVTFLGFYALEDSLRPEVPEAVRKAQEAGIRLVMITGDHRLTAASIAKRAGILRDGDELMTGDELSGASGSKLDSAILRTSVFARITPNTKMNIIEAYRRKGEIIAMTGDGVNDAPSLAAADLGVAMGKIGTEVAKEAADIVLLDDNFGTIVLAIEEGRAMYRTIQRTLLYLFSTNFGELLTIAGALVAGLPLPVLPAQILWLNTVTDPFMGLALALEPHDERLLKGKFRKPPTYFFNATSLLRSGAMSLTMMVGSLFVFGAFAAEDLPRALTISLTTLAIFQWFNAWNCRSEQEMIFSRNPFRSPYLLGATAFTLLLQIMVVYTPFFNDILHTVPLSLGDWLLSALVAFSIIVVEEGRKLMVQVSSRRARR